MVVGMLGAVVGFRPCAAELSERVGSEGAECEHPVWLQYPADFCKCRVGWIAPLQHQTTDYHVHRCVGDGEAHGVSANALEPTEEPLVSVRFAKHAGSEIESDYEGA